MGNKKIQHKTIAITPTREQGHRHLAPVFFAPPVVGAVGKPHAHFRAKVKESNTNAKMEISMDTIISLLGLFVGGGGGAFFTWRYMRRKAKAEAESAEVDTVKNMQDVVSNMQGAYDKMLDQVNHYIEDATGKMEEMRSERDRYKKERDELRNRFEQLENTLHQMRVEYQSEKSDTDRKIAQLGRKVEAMRPFLCGDMLCKKRQRVAILDGEDAEPEPAKPEKAPKPRKAKTAEAAEPKEIEPIKGKEL